MARFFVRLFPKPSRIFNGQTPWPYGRYSDVTDEGGALVPYGYRSRVIFLQPIHRMLLGASYLKNMDTKLDS